MRDRDDYVRQRSDAETYFIDEGIEDDRWDEHEAAIRDARNSMIEKGVDLHGLVMISLWKPSPDKEPVVSMFAEGASGETVMDMLMNALTAHVKGMGGSVTVMEADEGGPDVTLH